MNRGGSQPEELVLVKSFISEKWKVKSESEMP
jgi:hypothetical protein